MAGNDEVVIINGYRWIRSNGTGWSVSEDHVRRCGGDPDKVFGPIVTTESRATGSTLTREK